MVRWFVLSVLAVYLSSPLVLALKKGDCEVCVSTLERFKETLSSDEASNPAKIEASFRKFCKDLKTKENRFCYFLGGTADAATGILGEMSKPMSWGMPADKICEKLKKKDRQVKDLKKILNDWDESCDGCLEKSDFIKRIEELKPKHIREEL